MTYTVHISEGLYYPNYAERDTRTRIYIHTYILAYAFLEFAGQEI